MYAISELIPVHFGGSFNGIMIDTGAAHGNTSEKNQFLAYYCKSGREFDIKQTKATVCHIDIGSSKSLNVGKVHSPLASPWIEFELHIAGADVPVLLFIDDMRRIGIVKQSKKSFRTYEEQRDCFD